MTDQRMILVFGATGHVGRHLVSQLRGSGAVVRAASRNPDSAGLPCDVDVVRADLSDPQSLAAPLDGVESVFLVWPFLRAGPAPSVLDAITKHARRIVYLSSMGGRDDLGRWTNPFGFHADMEQLVERSGLQWTFLRPSGFATNTLMWAEQIRGGSVVRWPYGAAGKPARTFSV